MKKIIIAVMRKGEPMSDLISRQDAIDDLLTSKEFLLRVLDDMDIVGQEREKFSWELGLIESYINDMKELPSVESEIIRCKDCKYWTHIKRTNRYWCKTDDGLFDSNPSPDDFCSRAERKSDE